MKADLHIHTKYSPDGEYKVKDIVNKCIDNKIDIFAITDHNTVRAINDVSTNLLDSISFIPGIEIDCNYKGTDLHLLGYNIDWKSTDFETLDNDIFAKVMKSFDQMIHNLDRLGISVDASRVLEVANGKLPSAELIAEVLLTDGLENKKLLPYMPGGERSDMPYLNFYLDYFAQSKPAYVMIEYMSYADAIDLVKQNGGIPIVAHPGLNFRDRENIVEELLDNGAQGLEVFNNYHNEKQITYFAEAVTKRKALMTCGSDFHGKTKPTIELGNYMPVGNYQGYLENSVMEILKTSR